MKISIPKVLSLLGLAVLFSCKTRPKFETAANENTLLWEISGGNLKQPSYFLGTMHLMCAKDAVLSQEVLKVMQHVKQVYLEVDMDDVSELMSGLTSLSMKNGTTLSDLLTPEEYFKVKAFFEHHQPGLPFEALQRQQPLLLTSSLYELFLDCDQKNGIDLRIIDEASRLKLQTKGLETMAFQSSIFDSIPYEDQAKELVKSIDSIGRYQVALDEMLQTYKTQDIQKLYELSASEESGVNNHLDLLLFNRNKNWANQFGKIAGDSSTFFAVGAAHLGGPQGVINLLKTKGYSVRPLVN